MERTVARHGRIGIVPAVLLAGVMATAARSEEKSVDVIRDAAAVTYPEGKTLSIRFRGTARLPEGNGEAKVERKKGMTEIEVELDEMKPASLFGGNYNTYVLWTISPEGVVANLGEFILQGNRSKLDVSTVLGAFAMFVTAEPHFLVKVPSHTMVLENVVPVGNPDYASTAVSYQGRVGAYPRERESLADVSEGKGERRSEVAQAHAAVALAEEAGAGKYAVERLTEAKMALRKSEDAVRFGADRKEVTELGREAVRLAVAARDAALKAGDAAKQAAAEAERKAAEERARQAEKLAAEKAAEEKAAESRRAEEEQRRLAAEAEVARLAREKDEAKARLQAALGKVAETRDSARGLIVNLPDILFDSGKATLKPEAREVISRIGGIVLGAGGLHLAVEGHTDSVGGDDMNFRLSRARAEAVREYLVAAGIAPTLITTEGFGKTQPMADNATGEGRAKNRRVEIVIGQAVAMAQP